MKHPLSRGSAGWIAAAAAVLPAASATAHVTLLGPNGGETLQAGVPATITWEVAIPHDTVDWDLWYSVTGPDGPWIILAADLPPGDISQGALHTFTWTVPDTPSD